MDIYESALKPPAAPLRRALEALDGVSDVHDLHLWSLSSGNESLSGHLVIVPGRDAQAVLKSGSDMLERRFGLSHVTLQIELPGNDH